MFKCHLKGIKSKFARVAYFNRILQDDDYDNDDEEEMVNKVGEVGIHVSASDSHSAKWTASLPAPNSSSPSL